MTSPAQEVYQNSVYKYYDSRKILIYVGITHRGVTRNREHNTEKAWWSYVAEQAVEHFATREEAHAREIELIERYSPPFNVQHNPHNEELRAAYIQVRDNPRLELTAKQLISTGDKRVIKLYALPRHDENCFLVPSVEDMPIVACVSSCYGVGVYDQSNTCVGRLHKSEQIEGVPRLKAKLSIPKHRIIKTASARMRYPSLKVKVIAEVIKVQVVLE